MQGRSIGSKRFNVGEAAPQPTRASIYQEENTPLDWTAAHDLRAQLALPQRPAEPRALRHGLIASQLGLPMLARAEKKQALEEWVEPAAESVAPAQAHAAYSGAAESAGLDWSNNEQTTRYDEWELQKELVTYRETYPGYDTYDEHPRLDFQLPPVAAGHEADRDQRHELDYAQAGYAPAEYGEHDQDPSSPGSYPYAHSAQPSAARWHSEQPIRRVPERSSSRVAAEPRTATQGSFGNRAHTGQAQAGYRAHAPQNTGSHGQARVAPGLNPTQHRTAEPGTAQGHAGIAAQTQQPTAHRHAGSAAHATPSNAKRAAHTSHANAPSHRGFAGQTPATPTAATTHHGAASRTHAQQAAQTPNATTHAGLTARTQVAQTRTAPTQHGSAPRTPVPHAAQTHNAPDAARAHAAQTRAAPNAVSTKHGSASRTPVPQAQTHNAPNSATTHHGFAARAHAAQTRAAPNAVSTQHGSASRMHVPHNAPNAATTHHGFAARAHATRAAQTRAAPNAVSTQHGSASRTHVPHAAQTHNAPNAATTHAGFAARAPQMRSYSGAAGGGVQARGQRQTAQRAVRRYADDEPVVYPRGGSWLKRIVVLLVLAGAGYAGQHYYFNYYQRAPVPVPAPQPPPPSAASIAPAEPPAPPAAIEPSEAQAAPASPESAKERRSAARAALIAERWRERHAGRRGRDDEDDSTEDSDDATARSRSYARASDERDSSSAPSRATSSASQRDEYDGSETTHSERSRSSASANDAYVSDRHAAAQSGTLRINSLPWSEVHLDGQLVGHTPQMNLLLSAGKHRVTLVNNEMQLTKSLTVQITPGNITTHTVNLAE